MFFDFARVFCYDQHRLDKYAFKEVVDVYHNKQNAVKGGFALTGLQDYIQVLLLLNEYYEKNLPKLHFKEIRRDSTRGATVIDSLYNEPKSLRKEFSRILQLNTHVNQQDKDTKLQKQGAQTTQEVEFCVGIWSLYQTDYYPEIGDEVVWMGEAYQVGEVIVRKDHYHTMTGAPLHVTLKTINTQYGDEQMPVKLTDQNVIATSPPV